MKQEIVPGGCNPSLPLDPRPRRSGEARQALKDRIARRKPDSATEKEHLGRRIGRALRRLLRPSSRARHKLAEAGLFRYWSRGLEL